MRKSEGGLITELPSSQRRSRGPAQRGRTLLDPIQRTTIHRVPDPRSTNGVFRHPTWLTTTLYILLPSGRTAATVAFQAVEAALFTDIAPCRGIEEGEGTVAPRQSERTWRSKARHLAKDPVENRSLILRVFLPFVFGYYIAYLFRTINAVMAAPLASGLGLGAGDLGLLTSVCLLTFASSPIPIRGLLGRYCPRRGPTEFFWVVTGRSL